MSMTVATRAAPLFLIFSLTICDAHDPAQHKQWYKNLRSRANAVCCTGQDAEVITDANWISSNGNYRVILDGQWFDVHPSAVVPDPTSMAAHGCGHNAPSGAFSASDASCRESWDK